ncbi:uncharacterized protein DUF3710 [Barrientosiimonas humi]|uniref:Uncharacterized protein DUF3710 n=1 Tax=Barrientosiimonas humi TaxID=999931 RepID=A0A542XAW8_9MICO|nr:DUF3710 domain-containing protein [Barrientosiimonas humi]TQL32975.1 uncharacterized protein DUF3710 [Barrientosiimonas humi]CAG7572965.1 hypothetical protein BH39T_PBIAJDOK_01589 [Barrientosiimonas humi]
MGIFRRNKRDDDRVEVDDAVESDETDTEVDDVDGAGSSDDTGTERAADPTDERAADGDAADAGEDDVRQRLPRPHDLDRSEGPFDRAEIDDLGERLDLGALVLSPFAGSELRLDVDEAGQTITGVTVVSGESAVQVQAFAAPKSSGVWDDIRDEIADNLIANGGTAEEKLGTLGIELHARMPARGNDGRTTYSPVRFVGVDGPRWFLRGVLSGRAAVEDSAAEPLMTFLRQAIVVRGSEARAPRELLELTIPQELLQQAEANAQPVDDKPGSVDDLKPFERGPEITEVR